MRVIASAYSAGVVDQVKDLLGLMEEQLSATLYSVFGNLGVSLNSKLANVGVRLSSPYPFPLQILHFH